MEEVEAARQRNSSKQPVSTLRTSHSGGNTFSGGNFLNASMFLPPTLKYSGVSHVALDSNINKVEKWLKVAFEGKQVPDTCRVGNLLKGTQDIFTKNSDN